MAIYNPFPMFWQHAKKWKVAQIKDATVGVLVDHELKFEGTDLKNVTTTGTWGTAVTFTTDTDTATANRSSKTYEIRRRVCLICKDPGSGGVIWVAEEGG